MLAVSIAHSAGAGAVLGVVVAAGNLRPYVQHYCSTAGHVHLISNNAAIVCVLRAVGNLPAR